MAWQSLIITVSAAAEAIEALADALLDAGALSVSVEDADAGTPSEQALFGEPGADRAWPNSTLRALLERGADAATLLASASQNCGLSICAYTVETVADQDWVRATQAQFDPIRISARLWIVPSWHAPIDPHAINIVLDPGLAFGTGSHPTTRLCLEWLEQSLRGGETVLDFGCGSGILSIAAAKLGAAHVLGVDIDAAAVLAARGNAERNRVSPKVIEFASTEQPLDLVADVLTANILANPLKLLAPALSRHVRPGGRIVLSGILSAQAEEVASCYAEWFRMRRFGEAEGWIALEGIRRAVTQSASGQPAAGTIS